MCACSHFECSPESVKFCLRLFLFVCNRTGEEISRSVDLSCEPSLVMLARSGTISIHAYVSEISPDQYTVYRSRFICGIDNFR